MRYVYWRVVSAHLSLLFHSCLVLSLIDLIIDCFKMSRKIMNKPEFFSLTHSQTLGGKKTPLQDVDQPSARLISCSIGGRLAVVAQFTGDGKRCLPAGQFDQLLGLNVRYTQGKTHQCHKSGSLLLKGFSWRWVTDSTNSVQTEKTNVFYCSILLRAPTGSFEI